MSYRFLAPICLWILFSCGNRVPDSPVTLPKLISEGMVLQRDQSNNIWGKGVPGEKVRASLAGVIVSSTVSEDSTWKVQLPPLPAGGPYALKVNSQVVENVFVGDVWVAGGQSNMEWPLKSGVFGAEEEFALTEFPEIHFYKVPKAYSAVEESDVAGGAWKVANAENLPDFSAVAWFFAKQNSLEKNVPVGIIESNWGGTPAEGWTEAKVLAGIAERSYTEESKDMIENVDKWQEIFAENEKNTALRNEMVAKPDSLKAGEVASISYTEPGWTTIQLPAGNPMEHIAWVRKKFTLGSTENLTLHLPTIDQMAYLYVNGVQVYYKDWGVGMEPLEIPGELLRKGQNVLTIRAINTWDNRPSIGKKGEMYFTQSGKKINLEGTWSYSNSVVEPHLPKVDYFNWKPGVMFNAMIAPITAYGIKGVIWYQGESNAGRHMEYKELFSTMITNWRLRWDIGDFPFLFVQLANFMERKELQPDSDWAFLRDAQKSTLELPKTGMAVIIDIGQADDIHPRNKKDVGERLWLQAKKVAFNEKILASGPELDSLAISGQELQLFFKEVGEGMKLKEGAELTGFILEWEEGKFDLAKGTIVSPDQINLTLPAGKTPLSVRYAWSDNPEVNLVNSIGLPAIPFQKEL